MCASTVVIASGSHRFGTRSMGWPAGHDSTSSSTVCSMRGRIPAIARGVNPRFTIARNRVCSGGSEFPMMAAVPIGAVARVSATVRPSSFVACTGFEEKCSSSASAFWHSTYEVTTHAPRSGLQCTGSCDRNRARVGYGSST